MFSVQGKMTTQSSHLHRVVTVRESQAEKGLFYTGQGKSGNFKKSQGKNWKVTSHLKEAFNKEYCVDTAGQTKGEYLVGLLQGCSSF